MNRKFLIAAMLTAGAALAAPQAWAQTATPPDRSTDIPEELQTTPRATPGTRGLELSNLSAQELRDKPVYDRSNEKVATIKDVTGTPGRPRTAILDTGGVFGIGGKDVALPLENLSVRSDGKLVVNMTEDELKLLPKVN